MSMLMRLLPMLLCGLTDCGGGTAALPAEPAAPATPVEVTASDEIHLLFMGNSHTIYNDVPGSVAAMLRAGRPGKLVTAVTAPASQFLEAHWHDATTLGLLRQRTWSAVPVMFPEWARLDFDETQRIFELHVLIAQRQPACVAPIGQAWDIALARTPTLVLHEADGNHANPKGSFLAALVLYATLTGLSPADLPSLDGRGVDVATQALLRAAAAEAVRVHAPRALCPADRLL